LADEVGDGELLRKVSEDTERCRVRKSGLDNFGDNGHRLSKNVCSFLLADRTQNAFCFEGSRGQRATAAATARYGRCHSGPQADAVTRERRERAEATAVGTWGAILTDHGAAVDAGLVVLKIGLSWFVLVRKRVLNCFGRRFGFCS
jgi:hypothetical protein